MAASVTINNSENVATAAIRAGYTAMWWKKEYNEIIN